MKTKILRTVESTLVLDADFELWRKRMGMLPPR
jgi:hypothetical protein